MYLRFHDKISAQRVAALLQPSVDEEDLEVDFENVYEWAWIDLPGVSFSLDVTRDHGWSDVEDEVWERLSDDELEGLAGPTYVFAWDRQSDTYVEDIPARVIQLLCDATQSAISVYPGRINTEGDPEPLTEFVPQIQP